MTKVSIITPSLMRSDFHKILEKCIDNQTYKNIEHIIVEERWSYNKTYHIKNAEYIIIDDVCDNERVSIGKKYNLAHKVLSGDIVLRVDTDWFLFPSYVEDYVNWFSDKNISFILKENTPMYNISDRAFCKIYGTDKALTSSLQLVLVFHKSSAITCIA